MFPNMHFFFLRNSVGYTRTIKYYPNFHSPTAHLREYFTSYFFHYDSVVADVFRLAAIWVLRYECFIFECKCGRVWLCYLYLCSNKFSFPSLSHPCCRKTIVLGTILISIQTDFLIWIIIRLKYLRFGQSDAFSYQISLFYKKHIE